MAVTENGSSSPAGCIPTPARDAATVLRGSDANGFCTYQYDAEPDHQPSDPHDSNFDETDDCYQQRIRLSVEEG